MKYLAINSSVVSSFIDSGAGTVSPIATYMVCFSPSIEQRKQCYDCEANDLAVVRYSYIRSYNNERTNRYVLTDAC